MSHQVDQGFVPGQGFATTPREGDNPPTETGDHISLDRLVTSTQELYAETTAQFRDIGELAFMELELAVKSLQWGVVALLLLTTCSVLACIFLIAAIVLALANIGVSPALLLLVCGGVSAVASSVLYLFLRSLTKKMTFSNLRNHLFQQRNESK